jgi:hypothetical protein
MAASLAACLKAHGKAQTEADVNLVMGAGAMRGATWEDLTAAAQYFGLRSTLVVPSTVNQLREWTDRGTPVVIAYNPEGRPWSHASVVFDVTGEGSDTMVHIMDPNIPDPDETVRVMPKADFYKVWGEPLGEKMIVRRPACAVEREVTPEGRQVMASKKTAEAADCYSDYKAGGLTRAELEECLKRFSDQEDPYEAEGRNRYRPRVRPSGPVNKKQLDALNSLLMKRRNDKFIKSLRDQVQQGRKLSEKQLKAVRQNLYRNRMKPEADLFRAAALQASEERVAGKYLTEVREKKDKSKIKVKVQRGGNPHAQDALSRRPTRGHARKERGYNKERNPRKYTKHKHKNLEAGAETTIMDTFILEAARRVALRFAVDKTAVTSLKLIADAFRPFRHLIAEDPRAWGQWLKRAEREFRKAVDDAPFNDEDHFNFNVFSHSMGVEETSGRLEDPGGRHAPPDYGTATVKYPDSFSMTGGSSLHIGYEVYKLAKYADDSRGFVDAYRRVTHRQLKPLLKFLEYVIRGESTKLYLADQAVDEAEEEIRKILMAEQESDDGIEVLDFEVDSDSAEVQSLDFDWEDGADASITWEWEVVVDVGSVSVSDFDHDDDYGESDYKYDLRREEGW